MYSPYKGVPPPPDLTSQKPTFTIISNSHHCSFLTEKTVLNKRYGSRILTLSIGFSLSFPWHARGYRILLRLSVIFLQNNNKLFSFADSFAFKVDEMCLQYLSTLCLKGNEFDGLQIEENLARSRRHFFALWKELRSLFKPDVTSFLSEISRGLDSAAPTNDDNPDFSLWTVLLQRYAKTVTPTTPSEKTS